MRRVPLAFGDGEVPLDVPDRLAAEVFLPRPEPSLLDPESAVRRALEAPIGAPPLDAIARGRTSAAIAVPDATRAFPARQALPPLLETLGRAGIPRQSTTLLIATGCHAPPTEESARSALGDALPRGAAVRAHDARDRGAHRAVGASPAGVPLEVDARFLDADLRVVVGVVEPHLLAGFSGGRKLVAPGLSSIETLRHLHSPEILSHPMARVGRLEGNPFHEAALDLARQARVDFAVNLVLARGAGEPALAAVTAGDLDASHRAAVALVTRARRATTGRAFPLAVASGGGAPLDRTLYQCLKGAVTAEGCVRRGGPILLAGALDRGVGGPEFRALLWEAAQPEEFLARIREPGFFVPDQWMVQHLCELLVAHPLVLYGPGLDVARATRLPVRAARTLAEGLEIACDLAGAPAATAVLPLGPHAWVEVAGLEAAA